MDIPYLPEVVITDEGIVLVPHFVQCTTCRFVGVLYVNMSNVDREDKIHNVNCIICNRESVEIITYKLIQELRDNNFIDVEDEDIEDGDIEDGN